MNEESQNKLPPLRTFEEVDKDIPDLLRNRKWFGTDTTGLLLDFAEPYTPPKWTLSHNNIPFAKLGDLHIVSGKSGHGKTAFMSQIIATILKGSFGGMTFCLEQATKPIVLYVDTEQGKDDTIAIKNRVCTLAGIDYSVRSDVFYVARLRDTTRAEDRYKQILQLVWDIRPTVLFIDGLLDIVEDYNDQKECTPIIRELMVVATYYNISTWCVLHENPTSDKMVGSLGSIAQRKVTEVFIIRKHKRDKENNPKYMTFPKIFFSVEQAKARGKDQDDWYFEITDEHGWGMPREIGVDTPPPPLTDKEIKERQEADKYFSLYPWTSLGATYTDLERWLKMKGVTSNRKVQTLFDIAMENGIIYKDTRKKYHYKGIDKPFENDQSEPLPFDQPDGEQPPF